MAISDETLYANAPKARDLWLSTLPQKSEVPEHTFSEQFEKKMQIVMRKSQRAKNLMVIKRTVAAIIIVAFTMFSFVMAVDAAFRERIIEVVTEVFNELTDYRFTSRSSAAEQYDVTELPETEFGYIPDGFFKSKFEKAKDYEYVLYKNDSGEFIEMDRDLLMPGSSIQVILDTEKSEYEAFTFLGKEAYLNCKNANSVIIWADDISVYHLRSNLPPEELKAIAMEIK